MQDRLAEIKTRLKAATGGEWHTGGCGDIFAEGWWESGLKNFGLIAKTYHTVQQERDGAVWSCGGSRESNATFIAHAGGDNGDVDWLITEVKRLTEERDSAQQESLEQSRLLGMGGERELKLMAERDEALRTCYSLYALGLGSYPVSHFKVFSENSVIKAASKLVEGQ